MVNEVKYPKGSTLSIVSTINLRKQTMSLDNRNSIQQAIDEAYAAISEKFGVDKTEVTKVATQALGSTRQRGIPARYVQMMFKLGCNTNEVANHFGCTTATVHLKLKQDGLAVRQIKGMSVYDIFNTLPEDKRDIFLAYATYGDRVDTPLALGLNPVKQKDMNTKY